MAAGTRQKAQGSLTGQVTDRLRRAILEGELQLGEALSEDRLAARLGVSRSPVRQALATLQQEGLIAILPQRGSFVFSPTPADIALVCEFRRMVELEALALSFAGARGPMLTAMRQAVAAMDRAQHSGDHLLSARADGDFHAALFAHCGNPYLEEAYRLVAAKVAALRAHRSSLPTRETANAEHAEIVGRLAAGDLEGARVALSHHIVKMADRYVLTEPGAAPAAGTGRRRPRRDGAGTEGPLPLEG